MVPFSGMITHDGTITFTHTNGRIYNVLPQNPAYGKVKDKLREVAGDDENETLRMELFELSQPKTIVSSSTGGRVRVEGDTVLYDDVPVKNFIAERILWMITEGFDASPMMAFLEKVKENPSARAVNELYRFMEANKMGMTKDGLILAYKRVRADYRDIYTGKIDNSVGSHPSMPRNEVNDDPTQTCSYGLHVCSMAYLPSYGGAPGNRIVLCAIHPKDVVSVPIEYHNGKMRVCEYDVIGEIEDQLDDILGRTPVWNESEESESDWQDWSNEEEADEADESDDDAPTYDAITKMTPITGGGFSIASIRENMPKRAIGPDGGVLEITTPDLAGVFNFTGFVNNIRQGVHEYLIACVQCRTGMPFSRHHRAITPVDSEVLGSSQTWRTLLDTRLCVVADREWSTDLNAQQREIVIVHDREPVVDHAGQRLELKRALGIGDVLACHPHPVIAFRGQPLFLEIDIEACRVAALRKEALRVEGVEDRDIVAKLGRAIGFRRYHERLPRAVDEPELAPPERTPLRRRNSGLDCMGGAHPCLHKRFNTLPRYHRFTVRSRKTKLPQH